LHDEYTVYLSIRACYVEFLSSGKFPGTAWRPMPFSCYSWVFRGGTAWRCEPNRQTTLGCSPSLLGFGWRAWRWWTPARRREPILVRFWCCGCFGM